MKWKQMTAAAAAFFLIFSSASLTGAAYEEEAYRSVRVLESKGIAYVLREEEEIPVYSQMTIQGGDTMTTEEESQADLQLDDDKYVVVEASTKAEFQLEGDKEEGLIRIHLEEGAIYNEIENPLAENDAYEISTPDGVMAVRGTKFRVSVGDTLDGNIRETTVCVFEGAVHVQLRNSTMEETVLQAGEEAVIHRSVNGESGGEQESEPVFVREGEPVQIENLPEYLIPLVSEDLAGLEREDAAEGNIAGLSETPDSSGQNTDGSLEQPVNPRP